MKGWAVMRLDIIERKALRAVIVTLGVIIVIAVGLALWSRYRIYTEQKELEERRQYEETLAQAMEQELLVEGMTRGMVRVTLGPPDSTHGLGELVETWYYADTREYDEVLVRFERDRLFEIERLGSNAAPPPPDRRPDGLDRP